VTSRGLCCVGWARRSCWPAASYPRVLDEQLPAAHHIDARYANNPGDGTTTNRLTSVQVTGLSQVSAIAAGFEAGYALR
jgi:hypothetical protein